MLFRIIITENHNLQLPVETHLQSAPKEQVFVHLLDHYLLKQKIEETQNQQIVFMIQLPD